MTEDRVDPSVPEESIYDFVRRSVEHDRAHEVQARKRLVNKLAGRVIKTEYEKRIGSVVINKRDRYPEKTTPEDSPDENATEVTRSKPRKQAKKAEKAEKPKKFDEPEKSDESENVDAQTVSRVRSETKADEKLRVLAEVASSFGDPRCLQAKSLIEDTAKRLSLSFDTIKTFWKRSISREQKDPLLYGEIGVLERKRS